MKQTEARKRQLGLIIRRARQERELSQRELATRIGVSQANVSRWESGLLAPDVFQIEALSRSLERPVVELLSGRAMLTDDRSTLGQELAWWGIDLLVDRSATFWAVRSVEEVLVSALTSPDPRVIDRLCALFFLHPAMRPAVLWGHAEACGMQRRLGWSVDVAKEIVAHGRGAMTEVLRDRDERQGRLLASDREVWPWDGIGSPTADRSELGPIWQRWKIDYDRRFIDLTALVRETLEAARGR